MDVLFVCGWFAPPRVENISSCASASLSKTISKFVWYSLLLGTVRNATNISLYIVSGGQRAVIFNRFYGVEEAVRGWEMHLHIPWVYFNAIVVQSKTEQLITQGEDVSKPILETLTARVALFDIELGDFSVEQFMFGLEYASEILSKHVRQLETERRKYIVFVSDQENSAIVLRADGY